MLNKSSGTGNEVGQSNYSGDQAGAEQYSQPDNNYGATKQGTDSNRAPDKNEQPAGAEAETGGQKGDHLSATNIG